MMDANDIIVPCPNCGQRLRGSAERIDETARCPSCQTRFRWNASALHNPIQAPAKSEPWLWPPVVGTLLLIFGYALLGSGSAEIPSALMGVGIGLLFLNSIRARLSTYGRWAASAEGRRYTEIDRDIKVAAAAFARVTERRKQARLARDKEYLRRLSPRDFERHVADLFAALGYVVQLTPASNDEGIDAWLEKDGRRAIVQCKHLTDGAVGRPALQQFYGILQDKGVSEGFFVTTGRFTVQAIEFAKGKPIHLIDLERLVHMAGRAFTDQYVRRGPAGNVGSIDSDRWALG